MRIDILTLFPGFFESPLRESIVKRARDCGAIDIHIHNMRDHTTDRHHTMDDAPYGGGPGMVMKAEPVVACIESIPRDALSRVVFLTPDGVPLSHTVAEDLSGLDQMILLCGHYEGIDQRVREGFVDMELSIGDYVLTGGETAALVVLDAVTRLLPGVLGDDESAQQDSFADGLLDHPHYTRPPVFRDMEVPQVLMSGHHGEIRRWRRKQQLMRTWHRRPDVFRAAALSREDRKLLKELAIEPDDTQHA